MDMGTVMSSQQSYIRANITTIQANPLNTYLFSKPSFTSPQPLAAASGLTIPLQITLSEIKLSAFIILVFSRQKGLTLVFRNDPLESIKVSSTFDSIPFVREYLQKEIEMQLRTLMMDELPAIIHKLSLRLWCPEYKAQEDMEIAAAAGKPEEVAMDPFASPPQDAVDSRGNVVDASEISSLSLDGGSEIHSLFSQKNLLRLAALTDSHRTLSLFTPSIRDAVFRAWAGPSERYDSVGTSTPAQPALVRSLSALGSMSTTYTFSNKSSDDGHGLMSSRSSQVSLPGTTTGLSLGAGRHSRSNRKKKNRVVNLRRSKTSEDVVSESGDSETSSVPPLSEPVLPSRPFPEEPEDNIITPPRSPSGRVRFRTSSIDLGDSPRKLKLSRPASQRPLTLPEKAILDDTPIETEDSTAQIYSRNHRPSLLASYPREKANNAAPIAGNAATPYLSLAPIMPPENAAAGGVLEQTWILKMAGEIARRTHDDKAAREGFWSNSSQSEREPPPAYQPKA
jgi:distribution and morphology protein 34